ncbi:MAG: AzlD domain-containing protein, partial [Pseudomonadota bacterium]
MNGEVVAASLVMAVTVLLTRSIGYLVGERIKALHQYRDILEALPGCAMMSLITPSLLGAEWHQVLALLITGTIMWFSTSVALASIAGLVILLG